MHQDSEKVFLATGNLPCNLGVGSLYSRPLVGVLGLLLPIEFSKVPPSFWNKIPFGTLWGWPSVFHLRSPYLRAPEIAMYTLCAPFSNSICLLSSLSRSLSYARIFCHSSTKKLYCTKSCTYNEVILFLFYIPLPSQVWCLSCSSPYIILPVHSEVTAETVLLPTP